MTQTLNDLALLAIGIGGGLCLALVACMVYVLWSSTRKMQHSLGVFLNTIPALRDQISNSLDKLRGEVSVGLSRMDAERLYTTSLSLSRLVKSLGSQVEAMQKAIYAQPPASALDFTASGLDEEAAEDARMIAERQRWQQNQLPADPLAGLTEDEKRQRTLEYFEKRRASRAGFPYADSPFVSSPSAPPTAGSGIYASLLEEAASRPPAPSPAPDFSGLETDSEVDLVGKGELE